MSAWTSQRSGTHSSAHEAPDPLDGDDELLGVLRRRGRIHRKIKLEANIDDDSDGLGEDETPLFRSPNNQALLSLDDDDGGVGYSAVH